MATDIATTVTMSAGIPRYYDRRLLARALPVLVHYQMAQKGRSIGLASGQGHTVYWTRYLPLTIRTTAITEVTTGGISPVEINDMQVSAQCKLYGNIAQVGRYVDLVHIDQNIANRVDLLAQNMGESVDWMVMEAIHGADHSINRIRVDNDGDFTADLTADNDATATIIHDDSVGVTSDDLIGGYVICTDPTSKAYGESRIIDDNTASAGMSVSTAFSVNMSSTKYRYVQSSGLLTTDTMSTAGVRYAVRELKRKKALKFAGGNYSAILPIDCEFDFMKDTTWVEAKTYSGVTDLYQGEIGRWMGVRFVTPSVEGDWRETAAAMGTLVTTGGVYVAPFFGREAVGVVDLKAQPQKVYVRTWEQLGQAIPLYSTVGWEASLATKVLDANFAVGLMCGATV